MKFNGWGGNRNTHLTLAVDYFGGVFGYDNWKSLEGKFTALLLARPLENLIGISWVLVKIDS